MTNQVGVGSNSEERTRGVNERMNVPENDFQTSPITHVEKEEKEPGSEFRDSLRSDDVRDRRGGSSSRSGQLGSKFRGSFFSCCSKLNLLFKTRGQS